MQSFLSRFGLAAHLAIIAVAPLFLFPHAGPDALAVTWLWLSLFGLVWFLMEPSRIGSEYPHEARQRVVRTLVADPLFYCLIVCLVYAAITALNGGVRMAYDAEVQHWYIHPAEMPLLPGAVKGAGLLPFAGTLALTVVVCGVRHALGRSARTAFVAALTLLAGAAALVLVAEAITGSRLLVKPLSCPLADARYLGVAFGLVFVSGVMGLAGVIEERWFVLELLLMVALAGCGMGVLLFTPTLSVGIFAVAALLTLILSISFLGGHIQNGATLRLVVEFVAVAVALVMFTMSCSLPALHARYLAGLSGTIFPEGYLGARAALSRIAFSAFKAAPWLGSGLGSLPFDVRFLGNAAEFKVLPTLPQTTLQGWWQLVAERGVIGAFTLAVPFGFLLVTWLYRLIRGGRALTLRPLNFLFPVVTASLVAETFFSSSLMRPDVQLILFALLAVSSSSAPRIRRVRDDDKEK